MSGNETKTVTLPAKRGSQRAKTNSQMNDTANVSSINHKRPSPLDSSINKRLKSNSTVSSFNQDSLSSNTIGGNIQQQQSYPMPKAVSVQQQKSPHLLQHLMAPSPNRIRKYLGPAANKTTNDKSNNNTQWNCNAGYDETKSSDSVLKNLLVSGCDIGAGYVCHVPVRLRKLAKT